MFEDILGPATTKECQKEQCTDENPCDEVVCNGTPPKEHEEHDCDGSGGCDGGCSCKDPKDTNMKTNQNKYCDDCGETNENCTCWYDDELDEDDAWYTA